MKNFFKSITAGFLKLKPIVWLMEVRQWFLYRAACRKAMRMHKLTGKQYFVIPHTWGRFAIVDNRIQKRFNKAANALGVKKVSYVDLLKQAYFKTPVGKVNIKVERHGHGK